MIKPEVITPKRTHQLLEQLSQIGALITSQATPKRILQTTADKLQDFMDFNLLGIGVYEQQLQILRFLHINIDTNSLSVENIQAIHTKHLASECFDTQREIITQQVSTEKLSTDLQYISAIYLPLNYLDKKLGVLTVQSLHPNTYQESDLSILKNIAVFISVAIENAAVYKKMKSQNEEIMRQSREYQSLVRAMPQSLFRTDIEGRFTFANQAFLKQLGIKLENILGRSVEDFYLKEITDILRGDDQQVIESESDLEAIRVIKSSPMVEGMLVQMIKSPIFDMQNRVIGIQTTFWDITEKQKNQDQLRLQKVEIRLQARQLAKINKELEKRQTDIQLINARLETEIQRRTVQIVKTKEELDLFLYRASHDLRRPLTTLMGLNQVARLSLDNQEAVQLFDKVGITAQTMDKMLEKLLMVNEIHEASVEPKAREINIKELIKNTLAEYKEKLEAQTIQLQLSVEPQLKLKTLPKLLEIILKNLIENAMQFMRSNAKEGAYIKINAYKKNGILQLHVADNGQGIAKEDFSKVFKMYVRANTRSQGNGLGLYVVKKAIHALQGQISMSSSENEFTKFHILLPPFEHRPTTTLEATSRLSSNWTTNAENNSVEKAKLQLQLEALEAENAILQSLNHTKDQFLKILSNDFKKPIKSLFSFAQQVSQQYNTLSREELKGLGKELAQATEDFRKMIDNLFLMTILQLNDWKLTLVCIDVDKLIKDTIDKFHRELLQKEIELVLTIEKVRLHTDKMLLETILQHLLSNAIRFSAKKGKVTITAYQSQTEFTVCVQDNGKGIAPSLQSKIFKAEDKFSLPDTEGITGSGWGLVLCHDFIKKLGGKIWLESEPDKGSAFYFTIPFTNAKANC